MSKMVYSLTGFLKDKFTIQLDEALNLSDSKVRIIIEPILDEVVKNKFKTGLEKIRNRQMKRKFIPSQRDEVVGFYLNERNSWG